MDLTQRSQAFVELGVRLKSVAGEKADRSASTGSLIDVIANAKNLNGWFTRDDVLHAINCIADSLEEKKVAKWLKVYDAVKFSRVEQKKIGVLMAGNIPLVGFHDMLCVLISGHIFVGKTSSKDGSLTSTIAKMLIDIQPEFELVIQFEQNSFSSIDAIIATGSDNASTYIQFYFDKYPNLIRTNRNSIAILTGKESKEDLELLGEDIFRYFGLGCRNVSKIYVPKDYDFDKLFNGLYKHAGVAENNKYANNYDYNKAILLLDKAQLLDNGFLLLKEDAQIASPVGTLYYEYYSSIDDILEELKNTIENKVQCVVSGDDAIPDALTFGTTQSPELWEYADGIDTIEFLSSLS